MWNQRYPNRIQELREALGWTQEQLAFRSQLALQTVQRMEDGTHQPRRPTERLILHGLNLDYSRRDDVFPPRVQAENGFRIDCPRINGKFAPAQEN